jgi:hypothetical protein
MAVLAVSAEQAGPEEMALHLESTHLVQMVELLALAVTVALAELWARLRDQFLATAATAATPELLAKPVLPQVAAMVAQVAMAEKAAMVVPVAQQTALAQEAGLVETVATPATELPARTPELSLKIVPVALAETVVPAVREVKQVPQELQLAAQ